MRHLATAIVISGSVTVTVFGAADGSGARDEQPAQWHVLTGVALGQISDVCFVDERRGWLAFSDGSLLITTDGGKAWRSLALPDPVSGPLKIQLLRRADGSCFGWGVDQSRIYHTDDGTTWRLQQAPVENVKHRIGGVDVLDERHAWIYGYGLTWRTTDGGITWQHVGPGEVTDEALPSGFSEDEEHRFVHFRDENNGTALVATDVGWMTRATADSGASWRRQGEIRPYGPRGDVLDVIQSGRAVQAYSGGSLLYTHGELPAARDDIQRLLDRSEAPGGYAIRSHVRRFQVPSRRMAAAVEGIHRLGSDVTALHITHDGGALWSRCFLSTPLESVHFVDERNGWGVGAGGRVSRTTDGGETWSHTFLPTDANLLTVRFVNTSVGWAGGGFNMHGAYGEDERGPATVWRTRDGGETWQRIARIENGRTGEHSIPETVHGLLFRDENEGWAVTHGMMMEAHEPINGSTPREYGRILRTSDGGRTWKQAYLGSPLNHIAMQDGRWCAVGYRIVASRDGRNWENVAAYGPLFGAAFANVDNVFAVGEAGAYGQSADGGRHWTWSAGALFRGEHLDAVAFASQDVGWIGGSRAADDSHIGLYSTRDGGRTWQPAEIDRPDALGSLTDVWRDISAVEPGNAWAVSNNVIIRWHTDRD